MRNPLTIRTGMSHSRAILTCALVPYLLFFAACNTSPTFTAGSGNTFGTVTGTDGKSFTIETDNSGNVSKITGGDGSSFTVDDDGNITNWTAPDGSTYDFTYNDDNTVTVQFDITGQGAGTTTFDLGTTTGKSKLGLYNANGGDICSALNTICAAVVQFLDAIVPVIIDQISQAVAADTGIPVGLVRIGVESEVRAAVQPIYDFCYWWQLVMLVENPCETATQ